MLTFIYRALLLWPAAHVICQLILFLPITLARPLPMVIANNVVRAAVSRVPAWLRVLAAVACPLTCLVMISGELLCADNHIRTHLDYLWAGHVLCCRWSHYL